MKFSITNRKLMKMLFELGDVNQISGTYTNRCFERRWEVIRQKKNLFRDEEKFEASISGCYDKVQGSTLDEALDALEAKMEELAA